MCFKYFSVCHCHWYMSKLGLKCFCNRHEKKRKQQTQVHWCSLSAVFYHFKGIGVFCCFLYTVGIMFGVQNVALKQRKKQNFLKFWQTPSNQQTGNASRDLSFPFRSKIRFCQISDIQVCRYKHTCKSDLHTTRLSLVSIHCVFFVQLIWKVTLLGEGPKSFGLGPKSIEIHSGTSLE